MMSSKKNRWRAVLWGTLSAVLIATAAPGTNGPPTNLPGASIDQVIQTVQIKGQRIFRGSWNREPVDVDRLKAAWPEHATDAKLAELSAKYPPRGEGNVRVDRMIGLWVPHCEKGLIEGNTIALNADEALLIGPPDSQRGATRFGRCNGLVIRHNLIGHGLQYEGHGDDLDREIRGLEPHGHATAVLTYAETYNTQLHRNLIIGQANRALVYMAVHAGEITGEYINNVVVGPTQSVVNFADKGGAVGPKTRANIIGNLIVDGPDRMMERWVWTRQGKQHPLGEWPYPWSPFYIGTSGKVYMAGNNILMRDGTLVGVEQFLTDDELAAMPADPVPLGTPEVEIAKADTALLYDLAGGYGVPAKVGAGGPFDDWCLEQARTGQARPLNSIEDLPEHLANEVRR